MLTFDSFASSSKGNLYRVTSGNTHILIECGLPIKGIRQALNFGLAKVSGCLLTHEHKDHSKAAADIVAAGVDLYASKGTAEAIGLPLDHHRLHTIKGGQQFTIGGVTVRAFSTQHDCAEPLGFLLADGEDKLCFATDTFYLRWKFRGLTMIAIECNYAHDMIGDLDPMLRNRLLKSHMSLDTAKEMLRANDLRQVREIFLLHLSNAHSDGDRFRREIEALTGRPVYIIE